MTARSLVILYSFLSAVIGAILVLGWKLVAHDDWLFRLGVVLYISGLVIEFGTIVGFKKSK